MNDVILETIKAATQRLGNQILKITVQRKPLKTVAPTVLMWE